MVTLCKCQVKIVVSTEALVKIGQTLFVVCHLERAKFSVRARRGRLIQLWPAREKERSID